MTLLETIKSKSKQDLFVIEILSEPLLGVPAIKALNLLNSIKSDDHKYRKEFPELFTDARIYIKYV